MRRYAQTGKTLNRANVKCFFIACLLSLYTSNQKPSKSKHLIMSSRIGIQTAMRLWEQHEGCAQGHLAYWTVLAGVVSDSWHSHLQVNLQIQEENLSL